MEHHSTLNVKNDRTGSPRIDGARRTLPSLLTETQRFPRSAALARYEQELAYYRADAPFLSVEKSAARCATLSALLAVAVASSR
jgi:hypothetical protein